MQGLSGRTADAMFDAMMAGTPVPAMVPQLLHDPRLRITGEARVPLRVR